MVGTEHIVAFAAAFLAGAVNAVAGGGTLLTFPALIWLGLPTVTASATNTVALWPGSLGALWGYRAELRAVDPRLFLMAIPSVVGGLAGASLLRLTPLPVFDRLVPLLVLFATALFAVQEPIQRRLGGRHIQVDRRRWMASVLCFQLAVGVYGGYFGAGIVILMLAALSIIGMADIHEMNALKTFLAIFVNGVAASYFIAMGMVSWSEALIMGTGAIAGGIGGAGVARRVERRTVRWAIICIGVTMALSLALRL